MRSQFTEFSYGFAFTHGLITDLPGVTAAPRFPSLVIEGRTGYDVALVYPGLPIFFQYKLSDYLMRRHAKYWDYYNAPYYRFDITPRRRSKQHNLLKQLADSEEDVFYAAPLFSTTSEFDQSFLSNRVATNSLLASVRNLPFLGDDEDHHVTFTGPYNPRWHTEQWNLEGKLLEGEFSSELNYARIRQRFEKDDVRQIGTEYFYALRDKLRRIVSAESVVNRSYADFQDNMIDVLREIDYLLTARFGLEMVLLYS